MEVAFSAQEQRNKKIENPPGMRLQGEQLRSPWISKIPTQLFVGSWLQIPAGLGALLGTSKNQTGWEWGRTGRRIKDLLNLDSRISTWESLLAHPAAWGKSQGLLLKILIPNNKCPTVAAAPARRETERWKDSKWILSGDRRDVGAQRTLDLGRNGQDRQWHSWNENPRERGALCLTPSKLQSPGWHKSH